MALVSLDQLLVSLRAVLDDKDGQGHDTAGLRDRLIGPLASDDTGLALAEAAARLPLRDHSTRSGAPSSRSAPSARPSRTSSY